jgi:hypothetical protein
MIRPDPTSPTSALGQVIYEARALFEAEIALARAEMKRNIARMKGGVVFVIVAVLFALVALNALAVAAVLGLNALGLSMAVSALVTAGGFLVVALVAGLIAARRLRPATLVPERTINNIRADLTAMEEMTHV